MRRCARWLAWPARGVRRVDRAFGHSECSPAERQRVGRCRVSEHGKHAIVDVSRGWGSRALIARDEPERAAATRGTVAHRRDHDEERDRRRVDRRVTAVVPGGITCGVHADVCGERQQVSRARKIRASGGAEEAIGPDFGEALREHVLEEARDERVHRERDAPGLVGARVGVAEGDAPVCERFESVIGEGHVIDVPREIARRVRSAPDLLAVHGPRARPHGGIDRAKQRGPLEGVAHLRAKDRGARVARHEEARVRRRDPGRAIG